MPDAAGAMFKVIGNQNGPEDIFEEGKGALIAGAFAGLYDVANSGKCRRSLMNEGGHCLSTTDGIITAQGIQGGVE